MSKLNVPAVKTSSVNAPAVKRSPAELRAMADAMLKAGKIAAKAPALKASKAIKPDAILPPTQTDAPPSAVIGEARNDLPRENVRPDLLVPEKRAMGKTPEIGAYLGIHPTWIVKGSLPAVAYVGPLQKDGTLDAGKARKAITNLLSDHVEGLQIKTLPGGYVASTFTLPTLDEKTGEPVETEEGEEGNGEYFQIYAYADQHLPHPSHGHLCVMGGRGSYWQARKAFQAPKAPKIAPVPVPVAPVIVKASKASKATAPVVKANAFKASAPKPFGKASDGTLGGAPLPSHKGNAAPIVKGKGKPSTRALTIP